MAQIAQEYSQETILLEKISWVLENLILSKAIEPYEKILPCLSEMGSILLKGQDRDIAHISSRNLMKFVKDDLK